MATSSTCQGIGECRTWNQEIWVKFWINHLHSVTMGNLKRQRNLLFTFPNLQISQMLEPQTENLGTPLNFPHSLCSTLTTYERVLLTALPHQILTLPLLSSFIATTFSR